MSLQRRLLLYLLICAPLVWGVALYFSIHSARKEVDELFDAEIVRLARQVQATLRQDSPPVPAAAPTPPPRVDAGEADVADLAVAVWNDRGQIALADREGADLPYRPQASGFVDRVLKGQAWRIYYLQSVDGRWLVAAGQRTYERDELVYGLTLAQAIPWLLVLPVLMVVMAWAVRRALAPMRQLTDELAARDAHDLRAVPDAQAPAELKPLMAALNGLFARTEELMLRERRFMADAAHELRTPLAVLSAQWDVVRRSAGEVERREAEDKLGAGIERMRRLVTQMLLLSRVESGTAPLQAEVAWPAVVEQAMSDCLSLAERRGVELACEWPAEGTHPLPLLGDEHLLAALLRNLLDNAIRYSPAGGTVILRFSATQMEVDNDGEPVPADQLARLGERFYRPVGQAEAGSGLGLSIVRRIADLHGLDVSLGSAEGGRGMRVVLRFSGA